MNNFPLNSAQKEAVEHGEGPLLIVAGAGTGKTRVLTERIIYLINSKQCKTHEILALAYNNDAATELENRVLDSLPLGSGFPEITTFHSFCLGLVQEYGVEIGIASHGGVMEEVENYLFLREHYSELPLDYFLSKSHESLIKELLDHFGKLQKEAISPEKYLDFVASKNWEDTDEHRKYRELAECYAKYVDLKQKNGVLDFGDFHFYALKILEQRPHILHKLQERFRYILVDEYQDTDPAQNQIINLLADRHKNLTVVGDDDQCIYRFRGASIENINEFKENYPQAKIISLTENYRCTQEILDSAYRSIQYNNPHRLEVKLDINKKLKAQKNNPKSVKFTQFLHGNEEYVHIAEIIRDSGKPLSDFAILARKTTHLREAQSVLANYGIVTKFVGARGLYDRPEVEQILKIMEAVAYPTSPIAMHNFLALADFAIPMEKVYQIIKDAKKYNIPLVNLLRKRSMEDKQFAKAKQILDELTEFSRKNSAIAIAYKTLEIMGWKDVLMSEQDTPEGEQKILNVSKFLRKVEDFCKDQNKPTLALYLEYYELLRESGDNPQTAESDFASDAVILATVHRSKGLEWPVVFVPALAKRDFPSGNRGYGIDLPEGLATSLPSEVEDPHMAEERRLFYVACTRARDELHLSFSQYYRDKKTSSTPSPFLQEIGLNIIAPDKTKLNPLLENPTQKVDTEVRTVEKEFKKFSHSSLTAYGICPRKFYYMQIAKLPTEPSANQQFGKQIHDTLNEFMQRVRAQNTQHSMFEEEVTLDFLLGLWRKKFTSNNYLDREIAEKFRKRGEEICRWFFEDWKNNPTTPLYLEQEFKFPFEGKLITGRFDRVDAGNEPDSCVVIDYKTGSAKSQKNVDDDTQMTLYAMAAEASLGLKVENLTMIFLPDHAKVNTTRSERKITNYQGKIREIIQGIEEKNFEAKPDERSCQYCDFSGVCPFAHKR